jgi:hypothetical protein
MRSRRKRATIERDTLHSVGASRTTSRKVVILSPQGIDQIGKVVHRYCVSRGYSKVKVSNSIDTESVIEIRNINIVIDKAWLRRYVDADRFIVADDQDDIPVIMAHRGLWTIRACVVNYNSDMRDCSAAVARHLHGRLRDTVPVS